MTLYNDNLKLVEILKNREKYLNSYIICDSYGISCYDYDEEKLNQYFEENIEEREIAETVILGVPVERWITVLEVNDDFNEIEYVYKIIWKKNYHTGIRNTPANIKQKETIMLKNKYANKKCEVLYCDKKKLIVERPELIAKYSKYNDINKYIDSESTYKCKKIPMGKYIEQNLILGSSYDLKYVSTELIEEYVNNFVEEGVDIIINISEENEYDQTIINMFNANNILVYTYSDLSELILENKKIYIYCHNGLSISPSICMLYYILYRGLSFYGSYKMIVSKKFVRIRNNIIKELKEFYERSVNNNCEIIPMSKLYNVQIMYPAKCKNIVFCLGIYDLIELENIQSS
jgi:hypothetical protein